MMLNNVNVDYRKSAEICSVKKYFIRFLGEINFILESY